MGHRGGSGDHLGIAEHAAVTLRIRTLSHDGEIDPIRVHLAEGTEQSVDVSADASSVCGDAGGVDEHSRGRPAVTRQLPEVVIQTTGKGTPGMHPPRDRDTAYLPTIR